MRMHITLALLLILLTGCVLHEDLYDATSQFGPITAEFEITRDDVFAHDAASDEISVLGVELGDSRKEVVARVGEPDRALDHGEAGVNLEYEESLGMEETGLLFHLDDGLVTRITIMEPFADELAGTTDFREYGKDDIYFELFGVPPQQDEFSMFRRFKYPEEGVEVFVSKGEMVGFSLVPPQDAPDRQVNETLVDEWEERLE